MRALFLMVNSVIAQNVKEFPTFHYNNHSKICGSNALVLSGGLRFLSQEVTTLEKFVIYPAKADVFAHLYVTNSSHAYQSDYATAQLLSRKPYVKALVLEHFTHTVSESIKLEQASTWSCLRALPGIRVRDARTDREVTRRIRNLSQMRKIYLAQQLLNKYINDTGCSYRLVIRARPDISHRQKLHLSKFPLVNNTLYAKISWKREGYVDDGLGIGTRAVMEHYARQYIDFRRLCERSNVWIPEKFTTLHVRSQKTRILKLKHLYDYHPRSPIPSRGKKSPYIA